MLITQRASVPACRSCWFALPQWCASNFLSLVPAINVRCKLNSRKQILLALSKVYCYLDPILDLEAKFLDIEARFSCFGYTLLTFRVVVRLKGFLSQV